jgi:hypothetical protein
VAVQINPDIEGDSFGEKGIPRSVRLNLRMVKQKRGKFCPASPLARIVKTGGSIALEDNLDVSPG